MKFNLPQGLLGEVGELCEPGGGAARRLPFAHGSAGWLHRAIEFSLPPPFPTQFVGEGSGMGSGRRAAGSQHNRKFDGSGDEGPYRAGAPISTTIPRQLPWLKRSTLSTQRVMWPTRMAIQMSIGSSVAVCCTTKQIPSGTTTCETMEM